VPPAQVGPPPQPRADQLRFGVVDLDGRVWLPWESQRIGDVMSLARLDEGEPLSVDGRVVGYFFVAVRPTFDTPEARAYLAHTDGALVRAALAASAVALALGVVLTRGLTRPIHELIGATRALAQGKRGEQISVRSRDELGQLTGAFNQMSANLARAENARRQMTADVAHDLRTPLTVLGAYIESMNEGVLQPTPERFSAMQIEINHLSRLVDDLMTLARADAGEIKLHREPTGPADLLKRIATAYAPKAAAGQLTLTHQAAPDLRRLHVDVERMAQVLGNLVSNAIRHTPPGGCITLSADARDSDIVLTVRDSGEGIAPEALPHVFDRFFRADQARTLNGDEAGLGLAIAKSLVETHGARITVESQPGAGACFSIAFGPALQV
jgi:signal transduction histidine kinase